VGYSSEGGHSSGTKVRFGVEETGRPVRRDHHKPEATAEGQRVAPAEPWTPWLTTSMLVVP
jgi:hypothetical protein